MGPAGAGKTTVGALLAARLGWTFADADRFHSESNVRKMSSGIALTDADRWPWLDTLHGLIASAAGRGQSMVLACSALKQSYRDRLIHAVLDSTFVYLRADPAVLRERLDARHEHYMPAALLASQLADLEEPSDALVIDATQDPDAAVEEIIARLKIGKEQ